MLSLTGETCVCDKSLGVDGISPVGRWGRPVTNAVRADRGTRTRIPVPVVVGVNAGAVTARSLVDVTGAATDVSRADRGARGPRGLFVAPPARIVVVVVAAGAMTCPGASGCTPPSVAFDAVARAAVCDTGDTPDCLPGILRCVPLNGGCSVIDCGSDCRSESAIAPMGCNAATTSTPTAETADLAATGGSSTTLSNHASHSEPSNGWRKCAAAAS